jgi:hypothetical protein
MPESVARVFGFVAALVPVLLWMAFWLLAVDWKKFWPYLKQGAWVPFVLIGLMAALGWSRIAPDPCNCIPFVTIGNFWWQLGSVGTLYALALFAGWLQGLLGYTPVEVNFEPVASHGHGGHGHHDHGTASHGHETAGDHAGGHHNGHGHGH